MKIQKDILFLFFGRYRKLFKMEMQNEMMIL